jgi:predicted CopG family antitoxin
MSQLGEPLEWDNPWEGTGFEDIINELIQKTDRKQERLTKLESIVESLKYDFEVFKNDTIKIVGDIYKNLSEMRGKRTQKFSTHIV